MSESTPLQNSQAPPILFTGNRLEVDSKLVLRWNPDKNNFDYFDSGKGFRAVSPAVRSHLLTQILDQAPTPIKACSIDEPLPKEVLTFLALNRMERIPWASLFEMQFCVMEMRCPYPLGLVSLVASYRDFVKLERKEIELDI